jgi:nitrate/nitrite transporter NarK
MDVGLHKKRDPFTSLHHPAPSILVNSMESAPWFTAAPKASAKPLLHPIAPPESPVVQRHAIIGALGFGGFSAFWTTLAFYLANRPENFDSQITGLFGLVGVAGAMVAPVSGRLSDRFEARIVNGAVPVAMSAGGKSAAPISTPEH